MTGILTDEDCASNDTPTLLSVDELAWLNGMLARIDAEDAERLAVADVTLTAPTVAPEVQTCRTEALRAIQRDAHSHNFLVDEIMGKCRLSATTRRAEETRLKKQARKRKEYKLKSRKHWKQKDKTRKEYNNRMWERDPLTRIRYTFRQGCDITPEQWEEKVAAIWNRYGHKYLKIGTTDKNRLNIYNLVLHYHAPRERYSRSTPKPVRVYYGPDEAVYDSMVNLSSARSEEI